MAKFAKIKVKDSNDVEYFTKAPVGVSGETLISESTLNDSLESNLKTINNNSLVGTGNLAFDQGISEKVAAKSMVAQYQYQNIGIKKDSGNAVDILLFAGQSNSCGRAQLTDAANLGYPADISIDKA